MRESPPAGSSIAERAVAMALEAGATQAEAVVIERMDRVLARVAADADVDVVIQALLTLNTLKVPDAATTGLGSASDPRSTVRSSRCERWATSPPRLLRRRVSR